jgi:hypothetical protein
MTWQLKRTVQCDKCPWKKTTNPHDIPDGYDVEKHRNLQSTIAEPGALNFSAPLRVFACHEEQEAHCVGWLFHQLGDGSNIPLRLSVRNCTNIEALQIVGEQHPDFESTLPSTPTKEQS